MHQKFAAAAAFAVTALWSVAAWAHSSVPQDAPLIPLASTSAVGFVSSYAAGGMAALAVTAQLFTALRGRKALGTALVALTFWFGFQAAAHSVHHLGQPSEEARCAVASSAAQTSAIPTEAHVSFSLFLAQTGLVLDFDAAAHPGGLPATHEGRAPPRLAL
jgi:hypothetical protein